MIPLQPVAYSYGAEDQCGEKPTYQRLKGPDNATFHGLGLATG
jgi:hypothetical protein